MMARVAIATPIQSMVAHFAVMRVRIADNALGAAGAEHMPGEEDWLAGEHRSSGERTYYLSNLPIDATDTAGACGHLSASLSRAVGVPNVLTTDKRPCGQSADHRVGAYEPLRSLRFELVASDTMAKSLLSAARHGAAHEM